MGSQSICVVLTSKGERIQRAVDGRGRFPFRGRRGVIVIVVFDKGEGGGGHNASQLSSGVMQGHYEDEARQPGGRRGQREADKKLGFAEVHPMPGAGSSIDDLAAIPVFPLRQVGAAFENIGGHG